MSRSESAAAFLEALRHSAEGGDRSEATRDIVARLRAYRAYRWVGIYEVGDREIYVLGWSGPNAPTIPRFARTEGLCGRAAASRAIVSVDDVTQDPDYLTTLPSTRSEIVVPVLSTAMEPLGLIDVESEHVSGFSAEDREFLTACAAAIRPLWLP
jgi:putative methionine-R-sulfoxide reductase with GAF domain